MTKLIVTRVIYLFALVLLIPTSVVWADHNYSPNDDQWDNSLSNSLPGIDGIVFAFTIYDGRLIVGGEFTVAGTVSASNVAAWDGTAWSSLGSGVVGTVRALCVYENELVAAGHLNTAGGTAVNNIARWDGDSWSAFGSGFNGDVLAISVSGSQLFAGGGFTKSGNTETHYIASWDGLTWESVGSGMNANGAVHALAEFQGRLVAGGTFITSGGITTNGLAAWSGTQWERVTADWGSDVYSLCATSDTLFIGSWLCAFVWNGSELSSIACDGLSGWVSAICKFGNRIVLGGNFQLSSNPQYSGIAMYQDGDWSIPISPEGDRIQQYVRALAEYKGLLYVGGDQEAGDFLGTSTTHLMCFDGEQWYAPAKATDDTVFALLNYGASLIAAGCFNTIGGTSARHVASWNGIGWSPLGNGVPKTVRALSVYQGKLIAAGDEGMAEAWNGSDWTPLDTSLNDRITSLAVYNGALIAGGFFSGNIASWNGTNWSILIPPLNSPVEALSIYQGNLVAAGWFDIFQPQGNCKHIATWNGFQWSGMGTGCNYPVYALAVLDNNLVAGGAFTTAGGTNVNRIATWNGTSWSSLGSGIGGAVHSLAVLDEVLYAGGTFSSAGGAPANSIVQWNGSSWTSLGSGLLYNADAWALGQYDDDLIVGGGFSFAGGKIAAFLARWDRNATDVADFDEVSLPIQSQLSQNYPNPFNPETAIEFSMPHVSHVLLNIFDPLGRRVRTLVDEELSAGTKRIVWDGRDSQGDRVASGVYFYKLTAGNHTESKKMLLLK